MRKKMIVAITTILIAVIVGLLLIVKKQFIEDEYISIRNMPKIELNRLQGGKFILSEKDEMSRTVLFFFSPDCFFCEDEISEIISCKDEFMDVRWLFITQAILKDDLNSFLKRFPIMSIPNAVILLEDWPKYHSMFEVSGPPAMFVYDKKGNLINSVRGAVDIDLIKKWLR